MQPAATKPRRFGDRPLAAIGLMLVATICFTVLDGMGKLLVREFPVVQVLFVRYLAMGVLVLVVLAWRRDWVHMRTRRVSGHLLRALLLMLTAYSVFTAARTLPLSQIYAISHLAPLLVAALAALFLRERVRPAAWLLIALGFVGALVIIGPELAPGPAGGNAAGIFWAVMMAVGIAGYQVMTRLLGSTEHPTTQIFFTAVLGLGMSAPFGVAAWLPPDAPAIALMTVMGVAGYLAQVLMIRAFTLGEAALVAPFNYITLIWSAAFDVLVFAQLPGASTYVGAAIIVGSGLAMLWLRWRQRRAARRLATAARR